MATLTRRSPRRRSDLGRYLIIAVVVVYLVLPLLTTLAFSLATVWSKTILPEGYTLRWYRASLSNPQIVRGFERSLSATAGALHGRIEIVTFLGPITRLDVFLDGDSEPVFVDLVSAIARDLVPGNSIAITIGTHPNRSAKTNCSSSAAPS